MSELVGLSWALAAGVGLGLLYFAGLWWTVRKGLACKRPALLFLGSLLVRTGVVLTGFCSVAEGGWRSLVAALAGFVVARAVLMRLIRHSGADERKTDLETMHAH